MKASALITFLFFATITTFTHITPAKVVYVAADAAGDGNGSSWADACTTIAAGLTASASGDQVWVKSATYSESINIPEGVELYGGFAGTENLLEERDWRTNIAVIEKSGVKGALDSTIDGFKITGGRVLIKNYGIHPEYWPFNGKFTLRNCLITEITCSWPEATVECEYINVDIINCIIINNNADSAVKGHSGVLGIEITMKLTDCIISDNSDIGVNSESNLTLLENCIISGNEDGMELYNNSEIINCTISNNNNGIECSGTASFIGCNIANNSNIGVICKDEAEMSFTGCNISGNAIGYSSEYCRTKTKITFTDSVISANNRTGISLRNSSALLTGCTISDSRGEFKPGLEFESCGGIVCDVGTDISLTDCIISNNKSGVDGAGINGANCETLIISNSMVSGNESGGYGAGIICSGKTEITNCTISSNIAKESAGGIFCNGVTKITNSIIQKNQAGIGAALDFNSGIATLTNCTITGNIRKEFCSRLSFGVSGAIDCSMLNTARPESVSLTNCILWNVGSEFSLSMDQWKSVKRISIQNSCIQGYWSGTGNIDEYPLFIDPDKGDYRLQSGSACIGSGSPSAAPQADINGRPRKENGMVDIGAYEAPDHYQSGPMLQDPVVFHVRADAPLGGDGRSWDFAYNTISQALSIASSSDEIWVASGRYEGPIEIERRVKLYGGFLGNESLRQERNWHSNETIIDAAGLNSSAVIVLDFSVIDGFTITGGNAKWGGGIISSITLSPTIANCVIKDNNAEWGGGLYLYWTFDSCISSCIVEGNRAKIGGGVYSAYSNMDSCIITDNLATEFAGGLYCFSSSKTTNCIITNNHSDENGGGVTAGPSSLTNCTLTGNSANKNGGGVHCYGGDPEITNCILWKNGHPTIEIGTATPSCSWSLIQGGYAGEGNIDAEPMFADCSGGDYRLLAGSPCIDSGSNGASQDIAVDFTGNIRICDGDRNSTALVDMGAYEFGSQLPQPPYTPTPVPIKTPLPNLPSVMLTDQATFQLWLLDGLGNVRKVTKASPTPIQNNLLH